MTGEESGMEHGESLEGLEEASNWGHGESLVGDIQRGCGQGESHIAGLEEERVNGQGDAHVGEEDVETVWGDGESLEGEDELMGIRFGERRAGELDDGEEERF